MFNVRRPYIRPFRVRTPVQGAANPQKHDQPGHFPVTDKTEFTDHGPMPFVVNIREAAERNCNFRTALWTGSHLQVTLMSINAGEDIGNTP